MLVQFSATAICDDFLIPYLTSKDLIRLSHVSHSLHSVMTR